MVWTKEYTREYNRKYQEANKERLREVARKWREANPDKVKASRERQKESSRIRSRKWLEDPDNKLHSSKVKREYWKKNKSVLYARNRARILKDHEAYKEYMREYAAKNKEAAYKRAKQWKLDNPDKVKLNNAKRKAQKLGTKVGRISFQAIKAKGMVCGICGEPVEGKYHFDHIIPLARGGTHTQDNLQIAHPSCNLSKKASLDYKPKQKAPEGALC